MQIVSNGDNLHDMSSPVSGKNKKNINLSSTELAKESGKDQAFIICSGPSSFIGTLSIVSTNSVQEE